MTKNTPPLYQQSCKSCKEITGPLTKEKQTTLLNTLNTNWKIIQPYHLTKTYSFNTYMDSITFITKVATCAEKEDHHPNIEILYRKVIITLYTHKINGLTENDFILAAKCDTLL